MSNKKDTGVYQLDNGYWAYRYKINIDGVVKEKRRRTDELGKPFKTKTSAVKARQQAIVNEKVNAAVPQDQKRTARDDHVYAVKDKLKELGFKWAARKKAWTWHFGDYKRYRKGETNLDDIRAKYGSQKVNRKSKQFALD